MLIRFLILPALAVGVLTLPASGQLRPLDPFEWRLYDAAGPAVAGEVGGAAYIDQRAARAGTEGTLLEVGNFRVFWRTGRVVFEAAGTVQRFMREERTLAPPDPSVEPAPGGRRRDSGDYLVVSSVRLTAEDAPIVANLRFGARLPTTDDRMGLERDMTDFFALIGGSFKRGALLLGAETGVSINGTHDPDFGQKDVMPYLLRAEYRLGPLIPGLTVTGDVLGPGRVLRGNEPLGEVRVGFRTAGRGWLRAEAVAGYRTHSPRAGIRVMGGMDW